MALTTLGWQWPVEATPIPALHTILLVTEHTAIHLKAVNTKLTTSHVKVLLAVCGPDIGAFGPLSDEVLRQSGSRVAPRALGIWHASASSQASQAGHAYRILADCRGQTPVELLDQIFAS